MQEQVSESNPNIQVVCTDQDRSELIPLYSTSPDTGTLKLIVTFFSVFSVTLTFILALQIYYGHPQIVRHGSVTSDSEICSAVGVSIIKQGGNVVDAAITTAFCIAVVNPHITGLGGAGIMLIYDHRNRMLVDSIDFRATRSNDSGIGVPGFVAGLAMAHKLHGILPWKTLLQPAINIASSGFLVPLGLQESSSYLINDTSQNHNEGLREWLSQLAYHRFISVPELASVLSSIATSGCAEFYNTTLRNELRYLLDENDIIQYTPLRGSTIVVGYKNFNVIMPGNGSGGPVLSKILSNLNDTSSAPDIPSIIDQFHYIASWPFASGSSIVAFDSDDIYVSLITGLGSVLGSQILTKSGYIINNFLEVTKDISDRPTVLMTPVIATQNNHICGSRFALGASDVRDLSQLLLRVLENPKNISYEIESARVHMVDDEIIAVEPAHDASISFDEMNQLAMKYRLIDSTAPYPSINIIEKVNDEVVGYADSRGSGYAVTYK